MINKFLLPEIASKYDAYYISDIGKLVDGIEKNILDTLIKDLPRSAMLELGCGTGHWSNYFTKQGFNVLGIDTSEAMLQVAKGKNINAQFQLGNSENIPFNNESFEVIASITMLEFVDDQEKVIREINRVLKKQGWLILGCLNANSIVGINKNEDEVFKNAKFLSTEKLSLLLKDIGKPHFEFGVYMKQDYNLADNTNETDNVEPVFIACLIQKK